MQFAFEFVKVNSKKFPGSWTTNKSVGDWFRGCLSRKPEINLENKQPVYLVLPVLF